MNERYGICCFEIKKKATHYITFAMCSCLREACSSSGYSSLCEENKDSVRPENWE